MAAEESKAIKCFEYRLERCFEANALAPHLRSKASTTNLYEGLFSQARSRINQIGAFDNPGAVENTFSLLFAKKLGLTSQEEYSTRRS